jgi:hypothetical protein
MYFLNNKILLFFTVPIYLEAKPSLDITNNEISHRRSVAAATGNIPTHSANRMTAKKYTSTVTNIYAIRNAPFKNAACLKISFNMPC